MHQHGRFADGGAPADQRTAAIVEVGGGLILDDRERGGAVRPRCDDSNRGHPVSRAVRADIGVVQGGDPRGVRVARRGARCIDGVQQRRVPGGECVAARRIECLDHPGPLRFGRRRCRRRDLPVGPCGGWHGAGRVGAPPPSETDGSCREHGDHDDGGGAPPRQACGYGRQAVSSLHTMLLPSDGRWTYRIGAHHRGLGDAGPGRFRRRGGQRDGLRVAGAAQLDGELRGAAPLPWLRFQQPTHGGAQRRRGHVLLEFWPLARRRLDQHVL
jgi:hypothetical protein